MAIVTPGEFMMIDPFARSAAVNSARTSDAGRVNSFAGINTTRQDKFQGREQRRWGDSVYWDVPPPVLWLDGPYFLSPFDDTMFIAPTFIDIWA
jgi:hypothetical protein